MMIDKKLMVVFAGPNGSGKSTVVKNMLASELCPENYICPDSLVAPSDKENAEAYKAAMQKAETLRQTELALGSSFSFETVLSMPDKLDFIRRAKWHGYRVRVVYVTTDDPRINIERVKNRVAQGGHDVPEEKILSRYERCMHLMYEVACDNMAYFYDNSGEAPRFIAAMNHGNTLIFTKSPPKWFDTYVLSKAREDGRQILTIKSAD